MLFWSLTLLRIGISRSKEGLQDVLAGRPVCADSHIQSQDLDGLKVEQECSLVQCTRLCRALHQNIVKSRNQETCWTASGTKWIFVSQISMSKR